MSLTFTQKKEMIAQILTLLEQLIKSEPQEVSPASDTTTENPMEMLTVKECADLVHGLKENTVRQLVKQEKIYAVRAGTGIRGKMLVSKISLLKYLGIES